MSNNLVKIGSYIAYQKGKAPSETFDYYKEGLKPYLSPEYLRGISQPTYVSPNGRLVEIDDDEVIVLWDGSNAGEIFISKSGVLASTMTRLIIDEDEFHKRYFIYSMKYLEYILKAKTAGSGIPHVDKGILKNLAIFKPELLEQKAIAKILSTVDELIQATKGTITKAERLKKSLMQNLLSGKLKPDGTWRTEDEFYEDEKFGLIPIGWEKGVLFDLVEIIPGQSPPGDTYNKRGIGEPMLNGPTEFTDTHPIPIQFTTKPTRFAEVNDILFCVRGSSTGRMNIADRRYCIGRGIAAIRGKNGYSNEFIYLVLKKIVNQIFAEAKGAGSTFPNVNKKELGNRKVLIPTKDEVNSMSSLFVTLDETLSNKKRKQIILEKLKKSLMQSLLTGKKRINLNKFQEIIKKE